MIYSKINPLFHQISNLLLHPRCNPWFNPKSNPLSNPRSNQWSKCHVLDFLTMISQWLKKVTFDLNPDLTLISRPTFPNGSVPWRNLLHFWHWSHLLCNARWRRSGWSSHLYFPENDQMYISQIRYIWQHRKSRRSVYPSHQHSQREDLCLSLVLVLDSG